MVIKSLLVVVMTLLFAAPAWAQFVPGNRLTDAAARLSRDAEDFASNSYNSYTNSMRNGRNEIEAVMQAQQFGASARIFYRMVVDRRRNQELRDAFDLLQSFARSVERNNLQRSNWNTVQRSLADVAREINYDSSSGGGGGVGGQYPDGGRGGRMTWRGRVDDDIRITIRGGTADVETIGGTPYYDAQPNFTASLPPRRVNVRLTAKQGRGEVYIEQQPSRENDFACVVRIKDPRGGAAEYQFELTW
jgi:type II secretory pathway pseudopilin PulG